MDYSTQVHCLPTNRLYNFWIRRYRVPKLHLHCAYFSSHVGIRKLIRINHEKTSCIVAGRDLALFRWCLSESIRFKVSNQIIFRYTLKEGITWGIPPTITTLDLEIYTDDNSVPTSLPLPNPLTIACEFRYEKMWDQMIFTLCYIYIIFHLKCNYPNNCAIHSYKPKHFSRISNSGLSSQYKMEVNTFLAKSLEFSLMLWPMVSWTLIAAIYK